MPARAHESTFDRVLGGLGRVLEEVESGRHGKGGADGAAAVADAQRVAVAWVVGRALRPRHINWPRLIAATAAGIVLGEVAEALLSRRNGRSLPPGRSRVVDEVGYEGDFGTGPGPRSARAARAAEAADAELLEEETDFAEAETGIGPQPIGPGPGGGARDPAADVRAFLERAGSDLAVAAAYAAIAYPRLPGPPLLRAAVFGAADVMVSASGGVAATLANLSPRLKLPLARLLSDEERRLERALTLALALGLIYRDEEEEEEDDED